jgi:outer membrane protein assembly factor BamE (lipoprotein component of BamABCDE complex)
MEYSIRQRKGRTMRQLALVLVLVFFVAGCGQSPSEKPGAKILEDRTAWKKLTKGMTQDKVQGLLGEPLRVENQREVTAWYYQEGQPLSKDENGWVVSRGMLLFATKGGSEAKLTTWREP